VNGVFLDTVGLLGLWDEDDQWHSPAAFTNDRHFAAFAFEPLF